MVIQSKTYPSLMVLNNTVIQCCLCPRLVQYRESVEPKKIYRDETYWKKPIPSFGDTNASILVLGLAPASHGGNRTGRIFTGDKSGDFLFKALYETGLSNQPRSNYRDDGLKLHDLYITASVKCAPPKDKPTRQEFLTCHHYLKSEIHLLKNLKKVIVLGRIAFDAFLLFAREQGVSTKGLKFEFGAVYTLPGLPTLFACYHPSPHNTNTGRLTQEMLTSFLKQVITH